MNISIIIPNYNGEELLKKNLPKVFEAAKEYKDGEVEIVVVDDASTDASASVISNFQSQISNFKFIKNVQNLGFSSTVNRGVREVGKEVVILLNTDVAPEKEFIKPLVKHFDNEKVFAIGCLDKSIESGKVVERGRGIGRWEKGFLVHARGEVNKTNTLWVAGGSGAFRRGIWEELGGFIELYNPFYYEDIDLSYRALKSGYKIYFEPKSVVIHEHEKGSIKSHYSPFQIKTTAYKNQFIFVWHNATDLDLQLLHVLWLPYHFIKALFRGDFAFFFGFLRAFLLLPKIIQSSFKVQKLFVKKDRQVMKEFGG